MKIGITHLVLLILFSILLFFCVGYIFGIQEEYGAITYLLTLLTSHLILDKNNWLVDFFLSFNNESEKNK
ncbi:hypothetical protein J2X07_002533 [Fictibacillus barbaricus]|uniref:DUF4405 domain-containing protein n=1 Tax=Fictibacillus barbaricus TaxID=182136 RepID=A0ABU1U2E6_9BACL|nr:hypothetical protein [Fictibacillus barbaricus]